MTHLPNHRSGRIVLLILGAISAVAATGGFLAFGPSNRSVSTDETILLHRVTRADFEAFVTEPGDVASGSNVEVRCRVKSRGAAGTSILKICEEGTHVQPDDFLIQFDDSVLQQELLAQKIVVTNDKALLTQAENNLENAERTLREYEQGIYQQELETADGEVFVAEEQLQRAQAALAFGERLYARGFITELQLNGERYAVKKAEKDLAAAKQKLEVYKKFTREKMVGEYKAEIKKQQANVEAAEFTLALSEQRLAEIDTQIEHCLVKAPAAGQVVYANDRKRSDSPPVIEEGTLIRENQVVIMLPDLGNMQVDVKINEAYVNRIKPGQPAKLELDADPDNVLDGKVREVAAYPYPIRWHGAPIEYGAVIQVIDPPPTIRPGLRAKVKIMFEFEEEVLQIPLAAVIEHGERHYCLVRDSDSWRTQQITIGANNNDQVIVKTGLVEGEQVCITPFRYVERSDLPEKDREDSHSENGELDQGKKKPTADSSGELSP